MTFLLRVLLFICLSIICVSCANLGDQWIDLGDGYVYKIDGSNRWIRPDNIMKDGIYADVVSYSFDKNYIIALQQPNRESYQNLLSQDLRNKYESMLFDSLNVSSIDKKRFFASHIWQDTNIRKNITNKLLPNNQTSFEETDKIADSILSSDPFFINQLSKKNQYWIIVKKENILFGPFSKAEYFSKRDALKIPSTLELKKK